jgi:hypothetical protein
MLRPQRSHFCAYGILFCPADSDYKPWRVEIGDFVATKNPSIGMNDKPMYPFKVSWFPGQVLAIFCDSIAKDFNGLRFEIRVLKFSVAESKYFASSEITESEVPDTRVVAAQELLGPLSIHLFGRVSVTDSTSMHTHLPLAEYKASKSLNADLARALAFSNIYGTDDILQLRQFKTGKRATSDVHGMTLPDVADNEVIGNPGDSWTQGRPFRIDASELRAFYKEVVIVPRYSECLEHRNDEISRKVLVQAGDCVLIHLAGPKRYPFNCNFGVADILTIFEEYETQAELDRESKLEPKERRKGKIKIEIRWFYERHDISGASLTRDDHSSCNEVFETDHTQIMDAGNAILALARLIEDQQEINESDNKSFVCNRFWSTKRKSLIPCNGLNGRRRRGLLHSKCLPRDFDEQRTSSEVSPEVSNWKVAMVQLQRKLTLKDASKHAYEKGEALVGREKEVSELLSFFRAAIRGDPGVGGVKSSLICAGPPGGKFHQL